MGKPANGVKTMNCPDSSEASSPLGCSVAGAPMATHVCRKNGGTTILASNSSGALLLSVLLALFNGHESLITSRSASACAGHRLVGKESTDRPQCTFHASFSVLARYTIMIKRTHPSTLLIQECAEPAAAWSDQSLDDQNVTCSKLRFRLFGLPPRGTEDVLGDEDLGLSELRRGTVQPRRCGTVA